MDHAYGISLDENFLQSYDPILSALCSLAGIGFASSSSSTMLLLLLATAHKKNLHFQIFPSIVK